MAIRRANLVLGAQLVSGEKYCPTLADFDIAYGEGVTAEANGWRVHGSGGVHGRTSWNLLGGSIEFDMDVCGAQPGINSNFYTISPEGGPESSGYCDIQTNDSPICMELDIIENNGQCLGQTTWHVWGDEAGGCDQYGCFGKYKLDDGCKFHMRTEFGEDGSLTQYRNGRVISVEVEAREKNKIKHTMERVGSAIASTQWEGWVPDDGSCPPSGFNLTESEFAITNVVVNAPRGIKFGPVPTVCAAPAPPPAPTGGTYCPTLADFDTFGDNVTVKGNGWIVAGVGGVHGQTSWNLLGGSIEFDMDVCWAQPGINSNFYTISPEGGPLSSGYCDIQTNDSPICMELDIVENNGQCLGRTTWHVWGDNAGGCDQNGCFGQYKLDDGCKFHMRTEFGEDGSLTQYRNGEVISVSVESREINEIKQTMERVGSAIASTQWEGWVPDDGSCAAGGDLTASRFAITNVVVQAPRGITFGPVPPLCAGLITV